jgi:hypothetical protein
MTNVEILAECLYLVDNFGKCPDHNIYQNYAKSIIARLETAGWTLEPVGEDQTSALLNVVRTAFAFLDTHVKSGTLEPNSETALLYQILEETILKTKR